MKTNSNVEDIVIRIGNIVLLVSIVAVSCTVAKKDMRTEAAATAPESMVAAGEQVDVLPLDPAVTSGVLSNGLTYYIRTNEKPENRMELRLVVKAGSVLENEKQLGLAHFCEHMAFNGTGHFDKHELVDYLESIGMRFGPDLNAYTSFDQTVYMLQVPTDTTETVETAFQILEDWAHLVAYEPEEIDKERGVIVEEWRLGRGASARMWDKQSPVLFHNSRYAERLPIGEKEIIENFAYDTLTSFYHGWYRPNLQAVIAVGDFDPSWIRGLIERHFATFGNPDSPPARTVYPMPDHDKTLYAIATDPEATGNSVGIVFKHQADSLVTLDDYRESLIRNLYIQMLNKRLDERTSEADPPYLYGSSQMLKFIMPIDMYYIYAAVQDNGIERGFEALLTEVERVRRHGFTATELDRTKSEMLRFYETAWKERDKTESKSFTEEYIDNFLWAEAAPGIEKEYELVQRFLPGIKIEEINGITGGLITDENRVVMVDAPEKAGVTVPDGPALDSIIEAVSARTIEPYIDTVSSEPLVETPASTGRIISEETMPDLGVTVWNLSNGLRVVLKPTDFKNDEILFSAVSPGGTSLVDEMQYIPAETATNIIMESGVGNFSKVDLEKKLAGKVVSVQPWIDDLREGFSGSASPADIETLFQLVYLYAESPRMDADAYQAFKNRLKGFIENRSARPETVLSDTMQVTLAQYHSRSRPWTLDLLGEMDMDASYAVYRDRFADIGDFTFYFVGNFDLEMMRSLVVTYLGALPSTGRKETWRDLGIDYPVGVIAKNVRKGIEPKSYVQIVFNGPFEWNRRNRYDLSSMVDVLRIKLRETLREDMGGTYGVGVSPSVSQFPDQDYTVTISFGTAPDRVDEMTAAVFAQIDSMKTAPVSNVYLTKVKETQRRKREIDLKENSFWLSMLDYYEYHNEDPHGILTYDELMDSLTLDTIQQTARRYLRENNYVKVALYPADEIATEKQ